MSEIKVIVGIDARTRGVDSVDDETDSVEIASSLAKSSHCQAVTGPR